MSVRQAFQRLRTLREKSVREMGSATEEDLGKELDQDTMVDLMGGAQVQPLTLTPLKHFGP